MPEKRSPPDIAGWEEIKEQSSKEMIEGMTFSEIKCYFNNKSKYYFEAAVALSLWDIGEVIRAWAIKIDEEDERIFFYYLKLENGEWIKGKTNKSYEMETWLEEDGKIQLVFTRLSLETETGVMERLISKKI